MRPPQHYTHGQNPPQSGEKAQPQGGEGTAAGSPSIYVEQDEFQSKFEKHRNFIPQSSFLLIIRTKHFVCVVVMVGAWPPPDLAPRPRWNNPPSSAHSLTHSHTDTKEKAYLRSIAQTHGLMGSLSFMPAPTSTSSSSSHEKTWRRHDEANDGGLMRLRRN
uniref:Uncharacterized protein n=1 Tax=Physcomitrium patens TaxID=3218 RepID=A9SJX2_PHYPA|nr:hypothetical protein PHYPA_000625 [Physcomitrium patens]